MRVLTDADLLQIFAGRLQVLRDITRGVAGRYYTGAYFVGRPGTSKSWTVVEELERMGVRYTRQKGKVTANSLFDMLAENPDSVIVLDDLTNLYADKAAQQLLMAALDGSPRESRKISYRTKGRNKVIIFTGGIIAISNLPLGRDPLADAVRSRSFVASHDPSDEELAAFMRNLCDKGFLDLSPEVCHECGDHLLSESLSYDLRIDLRFLERSFNCRRQWEHGASTTHWKKLVSMDLGKVALAAVPLTKDEIKVRERAKVRSAIESNPHEIADQIAASGFSRSKFYRLRQELERMGVDLSTPIRSEFDADEDEDEDEDHNEFDEGTDADKPLHSLRIFGGNV